MRIAILHLDDHVAIPGGRQLGSTCDTLRADLFSAADGWDIRETLPGTFSLSAPWMPHSVTVGGYGYTYTRAPIEPVDTEAPVVAAKKGKR